MRSQLKLKILLLLIRAVYFLGGGGCLWLAFYFISENSNETYIQLPGIFLGIFFGIFGIGALYQMITLKELRDETARKFYDKLGIGFIKILIVVVPILLIYGFYVNFKKQFTEISKSELTTIRGIITNKVEVSKGRKSMDDYIYINLKEYPGFRFDITDEALEATEAFKYLLFVKQGDTLILDVKTDEFKIKLSKEEPLGFFDKYFSYGYISVYGLRDRNHNYLTLDEYNKKDKEDSFWVTVVLGVILLYVLYLLGSDLYNYRIKKKNHINP